MCAVSDFRYVFGQTLTEKQNPAADLMEPIDRGAITPYRPSLGDASDRVHDAPLASLAIHVLLFDPGVRHRQPLPERSARLPVENALDHRVVAIATAHPLQGVEIAAPPQLYTAGQRGWRGKPLTAWRLHKSRIVAMTRSCSSPVIPGNSGNEISRLQTALAVGKSSGFHPKDS